MSPRSKRALLLAVWLVPIALATSMRAERWERILRRAGVRASRADVYALVPVGYMGNNVLPARGGELLRTFLLVGTYDAAVIFATRAVSSASRVATLSYLVLLRFVLFVPITLAGLVLLVARYGGLERVRAARASTRAEAAASVA